MLYIISPDFSSWSSSPTVLSLPPPPLPRPPLPPPSPSHLLGWRHPVPTISEQPMPPASTQYSHRGPELAASQCIARPCSVVKHLEGLLPNPCPMHEAGSSSTFPLRSHYPVCSKIIPTLYELILKLRRRHLMYVPCSKNTTWTRMKIKYCKIRLWVSSNIIYIEYMVLFFKHILQRT